MHYAPLQSESVIGVGGGRTGGGEEDGDVWGMYAHTLQYSPTAMQLVLLPSRYAGVRTYK